MSKLFFFHEDSSERIYVPVPVRQRRKYGFFHFVFDCTLTFLSGGLWLIWVFVREMRR